MANFNLADYETVDQRIKRFYQDHPDGRIITSMHEPVGSVGSTRWVVKASIYKDSNPERQIDSTGYAFEVDGIGMANRTSALENCETSAIGRALANLGYSGDKRASREEMQKTQRLQVSKPVDPPAGWEKKLAAVTSVEGLQEFYEIAMPGGWWTETVKAAVSVRKEQLK